MLEVYQKEAERYGIPAVVWQNEAGNMQNNVKVWRIKMNEEEKRKYDVMIKIADNLDEILCSYQGRNHQSVYIDVDALAVFISNLMAGEIKMQDYQYQYDVNIREDEMAVGIYREIAPQTRWRVGCQTQIEAIRMNALKQFAHMGTPVYEEQIYYRDTESVLVCGEILPREINKLFAEWQNVKVLYVFPYPYKNEDQMAKYYSFEPSEVARDEMKKYMKQVFDKLYRFMEENHI